MAKEKDTVPDRRVIADIRIDVDMAHLIRANGGQTKEENIVADVDNKARQEKNGGGNVSFHDRKDSVLRRNAIDLFLKVNTGQGSTSEVMDVYVVEESETAVKETEVSKVPKDVQNIVIERGTV